jgi:hypothetical protein
MDAAREFDLGREIDAEKILFRVDTARDAGPGLANLGEDGCEWREYDDRDAAYGFSADGCCGARARIGCGAL